MNTIYIQEYKTKFGDLILGVYQDKLCLCDWFYRNQRKHIDTRIKKFFNAEFVYKDHDVHYFTRLQLEEYILKQRKEFTIPLLFAGTPFQIKVWESLLEIPYGKVSTYKNQALHFGNPNAVRAIAAANGANAISILVPCHRIVGSNSEMIGYAGGVSVKKQLLTLEATEYQQELFTEI